MSTPAWWPLARRQHGMLARRQLLALGYDHNHVRHQLDARRWAIRSPAVLSVTTGVLTVEQRWWLGVLHAGRGAAVGGLTALAVAGLRGWERPDVTVAVPQSADVEPLAGFVFARTRRDLPRLTTSRSGLPVVRIEPAALLFAGYARSDRTAAGLLAATVQQRLTTAAALASWIDPLRPLSHARGLRTVLGDIEGGAQSMSEIDVGRVCRRFGLPLPDRQVRRRDTGGRLRYTDAEWHLQDRRTVVLEVDGAFHMDVASWQDDIARERALVATGLLVVRCTSQELRDRPERVVADLVRLGVGGRAAQASA